MNKYLMICLIFLFFNNVVIAKNLKPSPPPSVTNKNIYASIPKQILSLIELKQMSAEILQNLNTENAFEESMHLDGPSLRSHILDYHVAFNGVTPQCGDAEYKKNKTLFISKTLYGGDVIQMLQEKIASTKIQDCHITCLTDNGILLLTIQIPVSGLIGYFNDASSECRYINICIKKVWLDDHWSRNLIPSTIYPAQIQKKSQIKSLELPERNLAIEYQKLDKKSTNECIIIFNKKKIPNQIDIESNEEKYNNSIELEFTEINDSEKNAPINEKPEDKRNGYGVMVYANSDKYEGNWIDGKQDGEGVMTYANGSTYTGEWKNGLKNGHGTMIRKHEDGNLDTYTGEFKEGSMQGQGVFKYASGDIYEGTWTKNYLKKGTVTNNHKYAGTLRCNGKTGLGVITYTNKDKYQGEWQGGKKHGLGVMTFGNGDVYDGEFADDEMSGQGAMNYANGDKYTGQWLNDKPSGNGELIRKNGEIVRWDNNDIQFASFVDLEGNKYQGKWQDDKPHGSGKLIKKNKDTYESTWEHGAIQFTEHTKFTNKNGNTYQGQWLNGKPHGTGVLTRKNGEVYHEAIWNNGELATIKRFTDIDDNKYVGTWDINKTGEGKCIFSNQDMYEGQWVNGKPSGVGKKTIKTSGDIQEGKFSNGALVTKKEQEAKPPLLNPLQQAIKQEREDNYEILVDNQIKNCEIQISPDGERYKGEFKNGKKHGKGKQTQFDGSVYRGDFKNDKKHGHGVLAWPDGQKYEGDWEDNRISNGKARYTWPDGRAYKGDFNNGRMTGNGIMQWPDGQTYEGDFKNNRITGNGIMKWPNGGIYEGGWENGNRNGHGIMLYANGNKYEGDWENDKPK